jgi:protoheme IX farnesyltransferase
MNTAPLPTCTDGAPPRPRWRTVLGVFKLRIGVLIMLTALVGMAVIARRDAGAVAGHGAGAVGPGGVGSAGAFNQYVEVDTDRLMARTRGRAFVTGALQALADLAAGDRTAAGGCRRRRLGRPQRGCRPAHLPGRVHLWRGLYLVAQTAQLAQHRGRRLGRQLLGAGGRGRRQPDIGVLPLLLALVLFLWTPPHFWSLAIANQADYAAAGVPMLPVVVGTNARHGWCSTAPSRWRWRRCCRPSDGAGPIYLAGAAVGGGAFRTQGLAAGARPAARRPWRAFFASLVQLSLVLAAATADGLLR